MKLAVIIITKEARKNRKKKKNDVRDHGRFQYVTTSLHLNKNKYQSLLFPSQVRARMGQTELLPTIVIAQNQEV